MSSQGLVSDGVVVYVNASIPESYTSGASLMNDLSGSSATFDFSTGPPVLSESGIDLTNGGNALKLSEQVRVQTISLWYSRVGQAYTLLSLRPEEVGAKVNGQSMQGVFFAGQTVYIDGALSTVTDFVNIPENVWVNVVFVGDYLSALTRPVLFGNYLLGSHYHATFRSALFYNRALTAQEIADNYATLLNFPDAPLGGPLLSVIPRALSVAVSISEVAESTGYKLTSQQTGSSTIRIVNDGFTDLEQVVGNLKPDTEYTLRLFSATTGSGYELVGESVVSTLVNSPGSYDVSEFGMDSSFDLSSLDTDGLRLMTLVMNDLFTTGDTIELSLKGAPGSKKSKFKFVNRGSAVDVSKSEALIAPFSEDAGSGQTFDMTLSDSSTATVTYDETTNSVTIDSITYSPGDSFVLDGKKVVIYEL
jgi:hypothetical protein